MLNLHDIIVYPVVETRHLMDISMILSTQFVNYCIPAQYEMARLGLHIFFGTMIFISIYCIIAFALWTALELIVYSFYLVAYSTVDKLIRKL